MFKVTPLDKKDSTSRRAIRTLAKKPNLWSLKFELWPWQKSQFYFKIFPLFQVASTHVKLSNFIYSLLKFYKRITDHSSLMDLSRHPRSSLIWSLTGFSRCFSLTSFPANKLSEAVNQSKDHDERRSTENWFTSFASVMCWSIQCACMPLTIYFICLFIIPALFILGKTIKNLQNEKHIKKINIKKNIKKVRQKIFKMYIKIMKLKTNKYIVQHNSSQCSYHSPQIDQRTKDFLISLGGTKTEHKEEMD